VGTLRSAGIQVAVADVRQPVLEMARRSGLADQLGENRIFRTIDEAVRALGTAVSGVRGERR
jgi:citrate lyase gamma subunit